MNRQASQTHPSPKVLAQFLQGKLPEEHCSTVELHIESCETCCEKLAFVEDDPFMDLTKEAGRDVSFESIDVADSRVDSKLTENQEIRVIDSIQQKNRYKILKKIGSGGMGNVYQARHLMMNRDVALKVIHPKWVDHPKALARFQQEVRNLAKLDHKNIVTSFDAEQADGSHFLVMELIRGKSAYQQVNENGPLAVRKALETVLEVSRGLREAARFDLVHRDIKPQNIMLLDEGGVKILDFGLTRILQQSNEGSSEGGFDPSEKIGTISSSLTSTNIALGTPDYLAPEQAKDATAADVRSDLYSLGCTLYFLLTAAPPFHGADSYQTIAKHFSGSPPDLRKNVPDIPVAVIELAEKLVEKSPALRFQTHDEFISAVEQILLNLQEPRQGRSTVAAASSSSGQSIGRRGVLIGIGFGIFALASMALVSKQGRQWLGLSPKSVVIVCPKQTYYPDFFPIAEELRAEGVEVRTASLSKKIRPVIASQGEAFDADLVLKDVKPEEFDAIVFVGGNMRLLVDDPTTSRRVKNLIHQFLKQDAIVSGVCAGTEVLRKAGLPTSDPDGDSTAIYYTEQVIAVPTSDQAVEFSRQLVKMLRER